MTNLLAQICKITETTDFNKNLIRHQLTTEDQSDIMLETGSMGYML